LLGFLALACAEPAPRELGFTQSAQELGGPSDDHFFIPASDFAGTWIGTAEEPLALSSSGTVHAYHFPSGSSSIVVELDADGATGHITFGAGEPPPPPEDADAGYPVGVGYEALTGYREPSGEPPNARPFYVYAASMLPPFEGFAYTVTPSLSFTNTASDGVLSLMYNTNEPLAPWCEMQTSYEQANYEQLNIPRYSCTPSYGGQHEQSSDGTGQTCNIWGPTDYSQCGPTDATISCAVLGEPVAQVNCDKETICTTHYCSCDATSCGATQTSAFLTVRSVGDELVGVFEDARFKNARSLNTPIGDVHLRRQ
jgi:hypothetical protein